MAVDNSSGANAIVVAVNVGPTVPQKFVADKDRNPTYIEGEILHDCTN
jgi:hypothetical protein